MSEQSTVRFEQNIALTTRQYVFGPVLSRRLGFSLGVDVIPKKLCNLDCVYCEVGRTDKRAMRRLEYLPAKNILAEIREALAEKPTVEYITFSGSGEPTLNSKLGEMIRSVKQMTDVPVAVITNGTLLYMEDVRRDLLEADVVLPSLDTATTEMFLKVSRPHPKLSLGSIVDGLRKFRQEYKGLMWLEILLVKGYNDSNEEILLLKQLVENIRPDKIQLNTVIRPPAESLAQPVDEQRMLEIREMFGERCEIIASFASDVRQSANHFDTADILAILRRRPVTPEDLADMMRVPLHEVQGILDVVENNALVVPYRFQYKTYYRPIENFFSGFCG